MWIDDKERVQSIVSALSDEYSRKIVAATVSEPKSPEQLSEEQGIPVSTCYRRIHDLLLLSIIRIRRIDLEHGKKSVFYESVYKDILVKFESSKLTVDLVPNVNLREQFSDNLQSKEINKITEPMFVTQDCYLCQSKDVACKVFVTGDSKSHLSVCEKCEKKMRQRNTIKAVEKAASERLAQSILNRI